MEEAAFYVYDTLCRAVSRKGAGYFLNTDLFAEVSVTIHL